MEATPDIFTLLIDKIPAAGAVIFIVWMFLKHISKKDERNAEAFEANDVRWSSLLQEAYRGNDRRNGGERK